MRARMILVTCITLLCARPAIAQWTPEGIVVCANSSSQTSAGIVSDLEGGAIVIWNDGRDSHTKTFAQRIDAGGLPLWTMDGIPVCDTARVISLSSMISDGAGGAIITWVYTPGFKAQDIYTQRISANGASLWTNDGVAVCRATKQQIKPRATTDGAHGVIIAWEDSRYGPQDTYAQRINAGGRAVWAADGNPISLAGGCARMQSITSDGTGGAIIAWADSRSGNWDIYAQRVDSNGVTQWIWNGVPVCAVAGFQTDPLLKPDGEHGAILIWDDQRDGNHDIYAQRIDSNGAILWAPDGVPISTNGYDQEHPRIISDGAGGAIIIWEDYRNLNVDIYGQRLDAGGNPLWQADGAPLCTTPEHQQNMAVTTDGASGVIITWVDPRSGQNGIYIQKVDADGMLLWHPNGSALSIELASLNHPRITSDLEGGAIIGWQGYRSGTSNDIFVQRVYANGAPVWTLLESYSVRFTRSRIEIRWTLSRACEDLRFWVLRSHGSEAPYHELAHTEIARMGMSYTVIDDSVEPGETYRYRIDIDDDDGRRIFFETDDVTTPAAPPTLYPNYPNPFNPLTTIRFYVPARCVVHLDIFDVNGNDVCRIADGIFARGTHTVTWDGRNGEGAPVASGVYLCRLAAGRVRQSRKMVLMR